MYSYKIMFCVNEEAIYDNNLIEKCREIIDWLKTNVAGDNFISDGYYTWFGGIYSVFRFKNESDFVMFKLRYIEYMTSFDDTHHPYRYYTFPRM